MQTAIIVLSLAILAAGAPKSSASKGNEIVVRSLDDLSHVGEGEVVRLKRVKRCEFAAAAPEGAIVNKRGDKPTDCEDVPTFITNW